MNQNSRLASYFGFTLFSLPQVSDSLACGSKTPGIRYDAGGISRCKVRERIKKLIISLCPQ
jgi:hypothetical protein